MVGFVPSDQVIEVLEVDVDPADRAAYLAADRAAWTAFLVTCPGFLGKEVLVDPARPATVILHIRWASRAAWKQVSAEQCAAVDARMGPWLRPVRGTELVVVDEAD
jgi:uncharacterized protein (TIGR03792 family)